MLQIHIEIFKLTLPNHMDFGVLAKLRSDLFWNWKRCKINGVYSQEKSQRNIL